MRIEHGSWYLTTIKNLGLVVDNVIMGVAVVAWIMAMAYGLYSGQLITALLVATPLLGFCFLLYRFFSTTAIVRMLQVITLMVMISLQVHLLGGMIEAHFGYFVVLAIAIAYFSSQAIIAGALAAAILHLVMHYLQSAGLPVYLFPPEHHSLGIVLLHAMYVAMEAIVLVGIIWLFQPLVRIAQVIVQVTSSDKLEIPESQEASTNPLQQQFYRVLAEHQEVLKRCDSAYEENNKRVGVLEQVSEDVKKHAEGSLQSIKTITQSMSDMTESFKQVASQSENSVQLVQQVSDVKGEALSRGQRVIHSVRQMENAVSTASESVVKLEKDCGRVADVLNEVEEITGQTNMLALNAAIEAARAGEHGRGFAVVADEVRSLATRTMEATTQINEVINDLIHSSKQTVQDINQTRDDLAITAEDSESVNESLASMAEHIDRILQSVMDISSAAHQQSETASCVNQQLSGIEETSVTTVEHAEKTNSLLVDMSQSFSQLKAI